ncbi:MAG: hypothetical protein ACF8XB_07070 [Planctomycetota bacterium JB042]
MRTEDGTPVAGATVRWVDESEVEMRRDGALFEARPDVEEALAGFGHETTSDADGAARLPATSGRTVVAARLEAAFGLTNFDPTRESTVVVALVDDVSLLALVVDRHGNPRPDVPVVLRRVLRLGTSPTRMPLVVGAARPGESFVEIPRARALTRDGRRDPERFRYELAPDVVLQTSSTGAPVALDPFELPREPVRLRTGATGAIRIRVENADGSPCLRPATVSTSWGGSHSGHHARRDTESGEVVFPHVLVDGPVRFHARRREPPADAVSIGHPGGRVPGGELVLVARLPEPGARDAIVRGRALDVEGRPIAEASLLVDAPVGASPDSGWPRPAPVSTSTDAGGRFEAAISVGMARVLGERLRLRVADENGAPRDDAVGWARRPEPLSTGTHDLGDVRLAAVPLLVAGTVTRTDGAAASGASVTATVERPTTERERRHRDRPTRPVRLTCKAKADGRFALHVDARDAGGLVAARLDGGSSPRRPFTRGERDVDLVVPIPGEVRVRLELDPDVPPDDLLVDLRRDGADPLRLHRVGAASFLAEAVPAGTWSAHVSAAGEPDDPAAVVEGVDVERGSVCADRRLDPIDLRGRFTRLRLRVVDRRGGPVPDVGTIDAIRGGRVRWLGAFGRAHRITRRPDGLDLLLFADGFRPRRLTAARGDLTVVLEDGFPVRVRADERLARLVANAHVSLTLTLESPVEGVAAAAGAWIGRAYGALSDGSATLPVAWPGTYGLEWTAGRRVGAWPTTGKRFARAERIVVDEGAEGVDVELAPTDEELDALRVFLGGG